MLRSQQRKQSNIILIIVHIYLLIEIYFTFPAKVVLLVNTFTGSGFLTTAPVLLSEDTDLASESDKSVNLFN